LEALPPLDRAQYDLTRLRQALQNDIRALTEIARRVQAITPARDAKLQRIKALLRDDLRGRKMLLFTYYRDTAVYLHRELTKTIDAIAGDAERPQIARLDGDVAPKDRARRIADFAPQANDRPDLVGSPQEIDILISTDVLSEGQNLQDCGLLVNYDLHWNPTRMVQRAGRIDRIGSPFETLAVYNVFPEAGLERLLGLVQSLSRKIAAIDRAGMLDTSVLGEVVHPRNFNTLQRIAAEDADVFDELEAEAELVSSEFLLATLRDVLARGDGDIAQWPDGIHSGRVHPNYVARRGSPDPQTSLVARKGSPDSQISLVAHRGSPDSQISLVAHRGSPDPRSATRYRGIFFYFTAPAASVGADAHGEDDHRHFWRYVDLATGQIHSNRYEIANLIRCGPDEVRVDDPPDVNAFDVQPRVKADILRSVQHRRAIAAAPKLVDKDQQLVITMLQQHINHPDVASSAVRDALKVLRTPLPRAYLKDLRAAYAAYRQSGDIAGLLAVVQALGSDTTSVRRPPLRSWANGEEASVQPLTEDDLHLVCWEYIWS
jgi:hypothetical protein